MRKDRLIYIAAGILFLILAAFFLWTGFFQSPKYYDYLMQYSGSEYETCPIVIVKVDDASINAVSGQWPWDRKYFASAVQNILAQNPKVIGIDFLFTSKSVPKSDEALKKTIENSKIPIVLAMNYFSNETKDLVDRLEINTNEYGVDMPIFGHYRGFVNLIKDGDGVIRRFKLRQNFRDETHDSFPMAIYQHYTSNSNGSNKQEQYIYYNKAFAHFKWIPFFQVYQNQVPKDLFENKIVLIGPTFAASRDFHKTPIENYSSNISGVEIFGHSIMTLLSQKKLTQAPYGLNLFIAFIMITLMVISFIIEINQQKRVLLFSGFLFFYLILIHCLYFYDGIFFPILLIFAFLGFYIILLLVNQKINIYRQYEIIKAFQENREEKKAQLFEKYQLSEREQEIVNLLIEGYKNPQIAKKLFISLNTVKFHLKNIYEKMNVSSRVRLVKLLSPDQK